MFKIYAILSQNFLSEFTHFFRRFLWTEKLNSADVILFWMYGTGSALRGGGVPVQQADQLVLQLHARWQAGEAAGRV